MQIIKKIVIWILTVESKLILRKYKPFIVAVTGSVGKTSTKDAIYCVLKEKFKYARKSQKSFNSPIGMPLTIIGVPNAWRNMGGWMRNMLVGAKLIFRRSEYPDCLILEVGADHPNDIKSVVKWLRPDVSVITKVSSTPVHVEFFKSPEEVFEEKASLATAVKNGGTLVLFADDAKVMSIADRGKDRDVKVTSFGLGDAANVRGTDPVVIYEDNCPAGLSFDMNIGGAIAQIALKNIIGRSYEYPLLAAAAVGSARGMTIEEIKNAMKEYEAPKARMNLIPGENGSTIIDDTYNSSPDAAVSALETLKSIDCAGRRIAVLGDMMELGKYSAEEHRKIGALASRTVSVLVTVGPRSRATADEAVKLGMPADSVQAFDTASEAAAYLAPIIKAGDIILIKGSQSVRMERVARALLRDHSRAPKLLVRQEKEWLAKA